MAKSPFEILPHLPRIRSLADVAFEAGAIRAVCEAFGWSDQAGEIPADDHIVEISIDWPLLRIVFVFSPECMGALPLYYLSDEEGELTEWATTSVVAFKAQFQRVSDASREVLGEPSAQGVYPGLGGENLRYLYWQGTVSYLILVEHWEGDANYGHDATIDFRLVPRREAETQPTFPLHTDVIF